MRFRPSIHSLVRRTSAQGGGYSQEQENMEGLVPTCLAEQVEKKELSEACKSILKKVEEERDVPMREQCGSTNGRAC